MKFMIWFLLSLGSFQSKMRQSVSHKFVYKHMLLILDGDRCSMHIRKSQPNMLVSRIADFVSLRGGSPHFYDEIERVPENEWRGIYGLGNTDESGRPFPSDSPMHDQGPPVEVMEGDDDFFEEDDVEEKQLPLSLLDYDVSETRPLETKRDISSKSKSRN